MARVPLHAGVPKLVNGTALYGQWQRAGGQAIRLCHALRETFGHRGNQVRMPQHIAQCDIVRHRQANPALQALAFQRLIHPSVARAGGQYPHMRRSSKVCKVQLCALRQGMGLTHQAHIVLSKQRLLKKTGLKPVKIEGGRVFLQL